MVVKSRFLTWGRGVGFLVRRKLAWHYPVRVGNKKPRLGKDPSLDKEDNVYCVGSAAEMEHTWTTPKHGYYSSVSRGP